MAGRTAWHDRMMAEYKAARLVAEAKRDEECIGYDADETLYHERGGERPLTFREFLQQVAIGNRALQAEYGPTAYNDFQ